MYCSIEIYILSDICQCNVKPLRVGTNAIYFNNIMDTSTSDTICI